MPQDDSDIFETQGLAGLHIGHLTHGEDLPSHDTGDLDPHGQTYGDEHLADAFAQGEGDGDDQEQGGNGPHHIDQPHHQIVDLAAEETAQATHDDADHQAEQHGDEAHGEADATAQHQTAEEVATKLVGAQQELAVLHAMASDIGVGFLC